MEKQLYIVDVAESTDTTLTHEFLQNFMNVLC